MSYPECDYRTQKEILKGKNCGNLNKVWSLINKNVLILVD